LLFYRTVNNQSNGYYLDTITVIGDYIGMNLYSVKEAAPQLQISERHLRDLLESGQVKGKKLGHDWVVLGLNYQRKRRLKGGNHGYDKET
jgi:hypothetical protein